MIFKRNCYLIVSSDHGPRLKVYKELEAGLCTAQADGAAEAWSVVTRVKNPEG